jgi:GWxTD domain-containing protein
MTTPPRTRRASGRPVVLALVGLLSAAPTAAAQVNIPRVVGMSVGDVMDSIRVLRAIDDTLAQRARRDDAALWHHKGMLAWTITRRAVEPPGIPGVPWQDYGRMADTSLRLAAELAPDSVRYRIAAAAYLATTFGAFNRLGAVELLDKAQARAQVTGDPQLLAQTGHAIGRVQWRLYQTFADRLVGAPGDLSPIAIASADVRNAEVLAGDPVLDLYRIEGSGESHYLAAERAFEQALRADPGNPWIVRDAAGPLVERRRWSELRAVGDQLIRNNPSDGWGYLTAGLAAQRLDAFADAGRLLERGIALLPAVERDRLDRLQRILPFPDTAAFNALPIEQQRSQARYYWALSDPLWAVVGDEPRTEFLARVVQADLRYSFPDLGILGAATDRGDMIIRWGPPRSIMTQRGDPRFEKGRESGLLSLWFYYDAERPADRPVQPLYFFGYEDLPYDPENRWERDQWVISAPVRWSNILTHRIDSLRSQVARFRGDGGVDVVYATEIPVTTIEADATLRGRTTAHWWLVKDARDTLARDSTVFRGPDGYVQYRARVPEGTFIVRAEGVHAGSTRAARSTAALATGADATAGFPTSGFGMSDLLLTAVPPRWQGAERWSDLTLRPVPGVHDRRQPLHVLWEVYEAGADDGRNLVDVELRLERIVRRGALGQAARIVARIIAGGRGDAQGEGEVMVQFRRSERAQATWLDQFTLALGESPPGEYRVTVQVTDQVTGLRRARSTEFELR